MAPLFNHYSLLAALLFIALCYEYSVNALSIHSSAFHGNPVKTRMTFSSASTLTMRKQKASDKRTRRRQRFGQDDTSSSSGGVLTDSSYTQSPMHRQGSWKEKKYVTPSVEKTAGRGRSRKRSALYQSLAFYHNKFLHLLTQEYQAEVRRCFATEFHAVQV